MRDIRHRRAGGGRQFAPQLIGRGVRIFVFRHVAADTVAERVRTQCRFHHADDGLALGIGDAVKALANLVDGFDMADDRVRTRCRIDLQRAFAVLRHCGCRRIPIGVEIDARLVLHPRGETLVEPQIIPPFHGDQIAEPLVRHFMRDDGEDTLLAALRRALLVVEQLGLEIENRAPIFHRAEKLAGARAGDHVELGQGIRLPEIVVIIGQQALGLGERIVPLIDHPAPGDDADFGLARHYRLAFDVAHAEEQQIARHFRRFREAIELGSILLRSNTHRWHIGKGRLRAGGDG
ncbi:hypothetical protein D9M73_117800 [compost metagenome]